jgi:hypothetical protein
MEPEDSLPHLQVPATCPRGSISTYEEYWLVMEIHSQPCILLDYTGIPQDTVW